MKTFIIIFHLFFFNLFFSQNYTLSNITKYTFIKNKPSQKKTRVNFNSNISKVLNGYKIFINKKKNIFLRNYEVHDSIIKYKLISSSYRFFLLKRNLYENYDYLLINKNTGYIIYFEDFPHFSNDSTKVYTIKNYEYENPQIENLQIFTFYKNRKKMVYNGKFECTTVQSFFINNNDIYWAYRKTVDYLIHKRTCDTAIFYQKLKYSLQ